MQLMLLQICQGDNDFKIRQFYKCHQNINGNLRHLRNGKMVETMGIELVNVIVVSNLRRKSVLTPKLILSDTDLQIKNVIIQLFLSLVISQHFMGLNRHFDSFPPISVHPRFLLPFLYSQDIHIFPNFIPPPEARSCHRSFPSWVFFPFSLINPII